MLRFTSRKFQQQTGGANTNTKRPAGPNFARVSQEVRKFFGGLGALPYIIASFGIASYAIYNSIYFVQGGCCAIKFNALTGLSNRIYTEGANLAFPFIETPIIFDLRNKPTEIITATGSKDLQMISLAVRVLYQPVPESIPEIYRRLGVQYADVVLPSVINEVVKAIIAQFNAAELLTRRPEVSRKIEEELSKRAAQFALNITDASITQMSFGAEYTAAIEAKQIANQNAERATFIVKQAEQEKRSVILLAEGEAEAARMIGEAMKSSPGFVELRRLENAKLVAKALSEGRGQYYLDAGTLQLPTNVSGNNNGGGSNSGSSGSGSSSYSSGPTKSSWI